MFYDVFVQLCESKGMKVTPAVQAMGLSKSAPVVWRKTGATPTGETLQKIADFFGVTTDYLLSGKESLDPPPSEGDVDTMLDELLANSTLMLDGKIASPEAAEYLRNSFAATIEYAKKINEKKE